MKFFLSERYYGATISILEQVAREQGATLLAVDNIALEHIPQEERGYRAGYSYCLFSIDGPSFDVAKFTLRKIWEDVCALQTQEAQEKGDDDVPGQ